MVYSAERGETWCLSCQPVRKNDKYFTYAQELKEEPLVVNSQTSFQPMALRTKAKPLSENRTTLRA
ncbi:MAG: hypothetical protein ACLRS8_02475 [Parabacteroides merdae]